MKKSILILSLILINIISVYPIDKDQAVELLSPISVDYSFLGIAENNGEENGVLYKVIEGGGGSYPDSFIVEEDKQTISIFNPFQNRTNVYDLSMNHMLNKTSDNMGYTAWISRIVNVKDDIYCGDTGSIFYIIKNLDTMRFMLKRKRGKPENYVLDGYNNLNYYPIGDYIFYIDNEFRVRALDLDGNFISHEQAMSLLKQYNEDFGFPENTSEEVKVFFKEKLDTGEFIVLGDQFYNRDNYILSTFYNQLTEMTGMQNDFIESDTALLGYDDDHNSYYYVNTGADYRLVVIFNKYGKKLTSFDTEALYTYSYKKNSVELGEKIDVSITDNGNIYFMLSSRLGCRIFRVNRTWGDPNYVSIAISGLEGELYSDYVLDLIENMDLSQLRLLRNTIFALKGYSFKSEDLQEHFGQNDWHKPNPDISNSTELLTDSQLRLFNRIREQEAKLKSEL